MDPTFKVELGIADMLVGEQSTTLFMARVHQCLPSAERLLSPTDSLQKLDQLQNSEQHKYIPSATQQTLKHISALLGQIINGQVPDVQAARDHPQLQICVASFQCFVKFAQDEHTTVYGSEALQDISKTL